MGNLEPEMALPQCMFLFILDNTEAHEGKNPIFSRCGFTLAVFFHDSEFYNEVPMPSSMSALLRVCGVGCPACRVDQSGELNEGVAESREGFSD